MSIENQSQVVPLLVSVRDASKFLGISEKTIRNHCSARKFPIHLVKIGGRSLFRMSDIQALVVGLVPNSDVPPISEMPASKRGRGRPRKVKSPVPAQPPHEGAGGEA